MTQSIEPSLPPVAGDRAAARVTPGSRAFALPPEPLRLLSYLRRYRAKFWIQAAGGILYNTVIVAGPIVLGTMLDAAAAIERLGSSPERLRTLTLRALTFVLVTIFFQYARYVKRWWLREMSNRIANDIRAGILGAVLNRPMVAVERESVGDLMARTVGDVNQIVGTVQYTINETWDTWLLMLSYLVVLLAYDVRITLLCALPIPLALYVAEAARHPLYRYSSSARRASSRVTSHLQRTLNGVGLLRLFGREAMENRRLEEYSLEQMRWGVKTALLQTGIMPVYAALASLGVVGVIVMGGQRVLDGSWTVGRFTAYLIMFLAMATRTRVAANVVNRFHAARASWDRIREKLEAAAPADGVPSVASPAHPAETIPTGRGAELIVEGLSYTYPGAARETLRGISFSAADGAFVAITGAVGSGKTALAAALTGLYPYQGSIRVGGHELSALHPLERTAAVAYAGQDSFIFSGTILENITMQPPGAVPADDPALVRALYVSALTEDLPLFPEGLATRVGERGVRVSGGQRQRIALARTLYADSPIVVVDDPFSAVDIGTERRMIDRLRHDLSGRTLVVCSHRLSAFVSADTILVLNGGEVVERGTHEELMAAGGVYQRIYSAQDWMEHEIDVDH